MPSTSPYDVQFRLLGIPVRVTPWFWVISALMGGIGRASVQQVAIWVACVLVSILVHEFGHGLTARLFGYPASVVLYGMGGLCYSEGERQTPRERLAVVFMGPGAGFLLLGLVLAGLYAVYRVTPVEMLSLLGLGSRDPFGALMKLRSAGPVLVQAFLYLIEINLFWGILNLLPIWPLDGGQITQVLLTMFSRQNGRRWSHIVSLMTAGALAIVVYRYTEDLFLTVFFGFFALTNFQVLQALHAQARYGGGLDDETEWWRR